jgi:ribosomal protein L9
MEKKDLVESESDATSTEVVCGVVEQHITRTAELIKRYKQRKQELERKQQDNPRKAQSIQIQIDQVQTKLNFWINENGKLQDAQVDLDCK